MHYLIDPFPEHTARFKAKIARLKAQFHCLNCGVKYPCEVTLCPDCGAKVPEIRKGVRDKRG